METDLLRSFFAVAEQGSLSKAASQLRLSQSTLTRQMQTLEHLIGGRILERTSTGVALTDAGHALSNHVRPALEQFEQALLEARRVARGHKTQVRIGYLACAAAQFLNPAIAAMRSAHPDVRVQLLDLSPGEQVAALRRGELDVAILGHVGLALAQEFYTRKLATLPAVVGLAETHPLAERVALQLSDLREESFVGASEADLPGHNRWVVQVCRRAGFKPRFLQDATSLNHSLSLLLVDNAVALLPSAGHGSLPGLTFRPLADRGVTLDLLAAWQRGKPSAPVRAFLNALPERPRQQIGEVVQVKAS